MPTNTRSQTNSAGEADAPLGQQPPQPSASSNLDQPSAIAQATAVHMQMTAGIYDQIVQLTQMSENLSKHIIKSDMEFKHDVSNFIGKISMCTGSDPEKLVTFIEETQDLINLKIRPESILLSSLLSRLQGELLTWWPEAMVTCHNWDELKRQLLRHFISPMIKMQLINSLVRRYHRREESFSNFIRDILRKAQALNAEIPEAELICQIWSHANSETLAELKHIKMPTSLIELKELSHQMNQTEMLIQSAKQREQASLSTTSTTANVNCAYCKLPGHHISACQRRQKANSQQSASPSPSKNC